MWDLSQESLNPGTPTARVGRNPRLLAVALNCRDHRLTDAAIRQIHNVILVDIKFNALSLDGRHDDRITNIGIFGHRDDVIGGQRPSLLLLNLF